MAPFPFLGRVCILSAQLCLLLTCQQCALLKADGLGSLIGGGVDKPEITPGTILPFLQDATNATANVLCALDKQYCPGYRNSTTPSPALGPAPAPAPGPAGSRSFSSGDRNFEDELYYELPQTRFTFPGVQTRNVIDPDFPDRFFDEFSQLQTTAFTTGATNNTLLTVEQKHQLFYGGKTDEEKAQAGKFRRKLAAAPPVAPGSNGGWTMFSTDSGVAVIHAQPLTNGQVLLISRPGNRQAPPQPNAVYNLNTNTYRLFPMRDAAFCAGHSLLKDGTVLIVGGDGAVVDTGYTDGRYLIRVFTGGANPSYVVTAQMSPQPGSNDPNSGARWYPSLSTMVDGNVLIVGGHTTQGGNYFQQAFTFVNPTYQFFNFDTKGITDSIYLPLLAQTDPITMYTFITVLPRDGKLLIISGALSRFYTYNPAGSLTEDTTSYPAIPNLPVPAFYPQTAHFTLLPLELPNYIPRILVVGGSSVDQATPDTPATANTYLLDLSLPNPTWQVETMSAPRVMPDVTILPDGTLFLCNGGNVGIAGGAPGGGGTASNNGQGGSPLSGEIYDPSKPFGQRMSGLLANSGHDRLYHSEAFLTTNAEVFVLGSEATVDYTMQIYTPPYLVGTFSRPLIANPNTTSAAYGATVTLTLTFAGGAAVPIGRAALILSNGVTHSYNFDQRSVQVAFTQTATTITVTMPPSTTVAPPGNYQLFVTTTEGRPSKGVYIGLGGATPAPGPFVDPPRPPVLADGTYTITARGRTDCPASLSYGTCSQSNDAFMGTGGVWQLTFFAQGSQANTYNIQSQARTGSCNTFLGGQKCDESNDLFLFPLDGYSGRQQWTLTPLSGGGYSIQNVVGRAGCAVAPQFLTAPACGSNTVTYADGVTTLGTWDIVPVAAPPISPQAPFTPIIPNGNYFVSSNGRATCDKFLSFQAGGTPCPAGVGNAILNSPTGTLVTLTYLTNNIRTNSYSIVATGRGGCPNQFSCTQCGQDIVDLFFADDGSGRQQVRINAHPSGGYSLQIPQGRAGCNTYMTSQDCGGPTALTFAAGPTTTLSSFAITSSATPTPNPPSAPFFANGVYYIQNTERTNCANTLSAATCANGNGVSIGTSGYWMLTLLPNAPNANTYQVTSTTRTTCNTFLSSIDCAQNFVDMYYQDDASGRQQWVFTQVTGGYNIQILQGRDGCASYLSSISCPTTGQNVLFKTSGAAGQFATWSVTAGTGAPTPTPSIQPGQYQINSVGRSCANSFLGTQLCSQGNAVLMQPGGTWTLTFLPNAAQANTFEVTSVSRATSQCGYTFLSSAQCPSSLVDIFYQDDASGRQQWVFTPVSGGYTITMPMGRDACGKVLTTVACGSANPNFVSMDTNTGTPSSLQVWTLQGTNTPPAPVTQVLPNGDYYIQNVGRATCANYTSAATACTGAGASNGITMGAFTGGGQQIWTFTNVGGNNLYNIQSSGRSQCFNFLSAISCPDNFIDMFYQDDGSGRQVWQLSAVTNGFTISMPSGRAGCPTVVTGAACGGSTDLNFVASATSDLQTFSITPVSSSAGK